MAATKQTAAKSNARGAKNTIAKSAEMENAEFLKFFVDELKDIY